jgi:hypothetical protein
MSRGKVFSGFMDAVNDKYDNKSLMANAGEGAKVFFGELALQGTEAKLRFEDFKSVFDELAAKSPETAEQILTDMGKLRTGTDETSVKFQEWAAFMGITDERIIELATSIPVAATAVEDLGDEVSATDTALEGATNRAAGFKDEAKRAERATRDLEDAYKKLRGEISDEQAWLNLEESMRQYRWDLAAGEMSNDEMRAAANDLRLELLDVLESIEGIPAQKQTEILALIDQGKFDEAELALSYLSRQRVVPINPVTGGQLPNVSTGRDGRRASGGPVAAGGSYLVGENGPEILQMGGSGGNVVPNHALGGAMNVVINTAADPNSVIAAIKQYERLNGKGWRS